MSRVKSQDSSKKQPRRRPRPLKNHFAQVERVRSTYALPIFMAILRQPHGCWSGKRLARLVGCDRATASRVADKLAAAGAVVTHYRGRIRCFAVAPECPAPPAGPPPRKYDPLTGGGGRSHQGKMLVVSSQQKTRPPGAAIWWRMGASVSAPG
jgi:hypothetical protein